MDLDYDEKSCGLVLFREENGERLYLLLHYPAGHWDLPKGHVEENEDEHETASRELEEETGITEIEFIDGFREKIFYKYVKQKKFLSTKLVVFFLAKTNQKNIKISFEHQNFSWLPFDEAYNKMTFDNAKNLLEKAEEFCK